MFTKGMSNLPTLFSNVSEIMVLRAFVQLRFASNDYFFGKKN